MKLISRIVEAYRTEIFFGNDALAQLGRWNNHRPSGVFILVDSGSFEYCYPVLLQQVPEWKSARVLAIASGEENKTHGTALRLWEDLMEAQAGRDALLVTLGGGMVGDLGGFVAAGYKRGIRYIHIPTTLLGQVDASIGGKTGININQVKNQVGFFYSPAAVFIYPGFLQTLPLDQLRSGLAEIIKSALIGDPRLWKKIKSHTVGEWMQLPVDGSLWRHLMAGAIACKNKFVRKDFFEKNIRGALNFGHTIGHAIETMSLSRWDQPLPHGEAVAAGMVCAAWLSWHKTGLSKQMMEEITAYIQNGYLLPHIHQETYPLLIDLLAHDKKNRDKQVRFTLLEAPGKPKINVVCSGEEILWALNFYNQAGREARFNNLS